MHATMKDYTQEDYIKYRITRATKTLDEIQTHIENRYWNTSINRMYYACFYAVSALLFRHKIMVSSHQGVRQKFGEHFVKTGKIDKKLAKLFTELFDKRNKGDYNDFFDYDEATVIRLYPQSREFVEQIIKLVNKS
jgi:uncharacterized protein (UPF0332 family)